MPKKKKSSKKIQRPNLKKRIKEVNKLNKKLFIFMIITLIVVVAIFMWNPQPSTTPGASDEFSVLLSNCLVDLSANEVTCDVLKSSECSEDLVLLVEDNSDKTMIAIEGSPVPMGSVSIGENLVAQIVNIPGESGLDESSGCKDVLLVCGQEIFSSTCSFV